MVFSKNESLTEELIKGSRRGDYKIQRNRCNYQCKYNPETPRATDLISYHFKQ